MYIAAIGKKNGSKESRCAAMVSRRSRPHNAHHKHSRREVNPSFHDSFSCDALHSNREFFFVLRQEEKIIAMHSRTEKPLVTSSPNSVPFGLCDVTCEVFWLHALNFGHVDCTVLCRCMKLNGCGDAPFARGDRHPQLWNLATTESTRTQIQISFLLLSSRRDDCSISLQAYKMPASSRTPFKQHYTKEVLSPGVLINLSAQGCYCADACSRVIHRWIVSLFATCSPQNRDAGIIPALEPTQTQDLAPAYLPKRIAK